MDKKDLDLIRSQALQEGIKLDDIHFSKMVDLLEYYYKDKLVKDLEEKNYQLTVEKNKYRELLNEKFLNKNYQTIAHQVGRLIIDFGKHPIKNFITPKKVLEIYAQYLSRKSNKEILTTRQVKLIERYMPSDIQPIEITGRSIPVINNTESKLKSKSVLQTDLSHKTAKEITVAVILDEFSYNSFKDEFIPIVLTPQNWKEQFDQCKPDLFFCESAWSGVDSIARPWKGKVYASKNFEKENRTELLEIIQYCNYNGIPTIFWNKEDPTHYPDRIHDFVKTAQLFDFVFTTAEECVEKYKSDYKLQNVFALSFATNPQLFNPIEEGKERNSTVTFAGSWYANHIERSVAMEHIFDELISHDFDIEFYNRYFSDTDPNHLLPLKYRKYEKPNVPNSEIAAIYKSSVLGLNINTVTDSNTMFARRVFELMSSNTLVLSNYSVGMDKIFKDNVIFLNDGMKKLKSLSKNEIDHIREENLTNVLENHTYSKRFSEILNHIGIKYNQQECRLTLVVKVFNENDIKYEINNFHKKYSDKKTKLLLVLSHHIEDILIAQMYSEFNNGAINIISESYIKNYSEEKSNFVETPFFALVDSVDQYDESLIDKVLLHTSYINNGYISLIPHKDTKYIFEESFIVRNILGPKKCFLEILHNMNQKMNKKIYFTSSKEN